MTHIAMEAQLAISALTSTVLVTYFDVCSFVMLVYDHILTLSLETSLVWPAPWSLGKVLYLLTPYLAFAETGMNIYMDYPGGTAPSLQSCARRYKARIWMLVCGMSLAEAVLVYRTWAIWGRTRKLAVIFAATWAVAQLILLLVVDISIKSIQFIPRLSPRTLNCVLLKGVKASGFVGYLTLTVLESITVGLTLYITRSNLPRGSYASKLYVTLWRDGIVYYVCLFGFSVVNMITLIIMPNRAPLVSMHRVLHVILIKRILLNLRNAASQDNVTWSPSRPFISEMSFAQDQQASRDFEESFTRVQHDEVFELTHRARSMSVDRRDGPLKRMHGAREMSADKP